MGESDQYKFDLTFVSGDRLKELAERLDAPFYLYDEKGIRESIRQLFREFSWCRGFREYFPLRLTPNPVILQVFAEEGCGVSCCSQQELLVAERCGFSGEQIIYDTMYPVKEAAQHMKMLHGTFVVNSVESAQRLLELQIVPDRVLLRYNPGGKFTDQAQTFSRPERSKLGMESQALLKTAALFQAAGTKHIGLSAALSKQTLEAKYFGAIINLLLRQSDVLLHETGICADRFDLGGGLGLGFLPELHNADIGAVSAYAKKAVEGSGRATLPEITASVGRLITGPSGIFVARVLYVKHSYRNYAVLDASTSNFIRPRMNAYHHVSVAGKAQTGDRLYYDVVGNVPDTMDRFAEKRLLPPIEAGDFCVIHDAGFLSSAMQTLYAGAGRCAEYLYTIGGDAVEIGAKGCA